MGCLLECTEQYRTTKGKVWACLCRGSCPPHGLPTPSSRPWCFGNTGVESFAHFDFPHFFTWVCGCVPDSVMRLRRLLYLLLSLNTARPVPVVTDLCWENSSDWIWKLFKQSGRLGCLIFMRMLRLLSWWSAGPQGSHLHGSLSRQIWRAQSRASSSRTIRTEYLC